MDLNDSVSKYSFYQQIRLLLRYVRQGNNTDDTTLLKTRLQMVSALSLSAPHGEIESLQQSTPGSPVRVTIWGNGLTGTLGALPRVYSEWMIARYYRYGDSSAKAFLNLFDHRLYTLRYLAWQKHHLYAQAESGSALSLHKPLLALCGQFNSTYSIDMYQHAALFSTSVRSKVNLCRWIEARFAVTAKIQPFTGGWQKVDKNECCRLGNTGLSLGDAPMIGTVRRDISACFDVILGPMSRKESARFVQHNATRQALWQHIRDYVGPGLGFKISLLINKDRQSMATPLGCGALGIDLRVGLIHPQEIYPVPLSPPCDV